MKKMFLAIVLLLTTITAIAASDDTSLNLQLPKYQPKASDGAKQPIQNPITMPQKSPQQAQRSIPITVPSDGGSSISISGQNCRGSGGSATCNGLEVEKSLHKPSVSVGLEGGF